MAQKRRQRHCFFASTWERVHQMLDEAKKVYGEDIEINITNTSFGGYLVDILQ